MTRNVWFIYFYLDHMVGLSCQFEMYVNIMLGNNKMVQDGCVKSTRGEEQEGSMEKLNLMLRSVDL